MDSPAPALGAVLTRRGVAEDADVQATIMPAHAGASRALIEAVPTMPGDSEDAKALKVSAPPAGELVSDLALLETLARGGSSVIRVAEQPSLDREVVIKSLLPTRRSERDVDGLYREASVAGRLDHPNVVPVHALGFSEEDGPFLVMKRVVGRSWASHLDEVEERDTAWLARQLRVLLEVCRAVSFAHDRGIVHRDIKPANVMLGEYGEVYLLDWGAALYADADDREQRCELVGTPAYMAPEQVEPDQPADRRTDVYLLGACLAHVLTGAPPHTQDGGEGLGLLDVLERARLSAPVEFDDDVPSLLAAVVRRACARDPDARYQTVTDLRGAITDYLDHHSSRETAARADAEAGALSDLVAASRGAETADQERQVQIQRRFAVARFAYEQALSEWADNDAARDGLAELLLSMARFELGRGNRVAAEALLSELEEPPEEMRAAVETLRAEEVARAEALDEVARIREQQRFVGVDWTRTVLAAVGGVACGLMGLFLGWTERHWIGLDPGIVSLAFLVGAVSTMVVIHVYREHLTDSEYYRRFLQGYTALMWTGSAYQACAWALDVPIEQTWMGMCFVGVGTALALAATIERRMWVTAAIAGSVAPLAQLYPSYAPDIIGAGFLVNGLYLAWAVRPGQDFAGSGGKRPRSAIGDE